MNRRDFLVGTTASGVALATLPLMPPAVALESPAGAEAAISLIEHKIRETFAYFVLCDEQETLPAEWRTFYEVWKNREDLRIMIKEQLEIIFWDPGFKEIKQRFGSIFDPDGHLSLQPQLALFARIPVMPCECDRKLFDAYALFAPPHLL